MNTDKKKEIEQKQKRRYQLLLALWNSVNGKENTPIDFLEVAISAGFNEDEASEIYDYFNGEGFLCNMTVGWGVELSHRAITEVENSLTNPQPSTEHFPSTVIQNFHAPVGSAQTGSRNITIVNQNIGKNFSEILGHLANLKREFQSLPDGDREEAIEVVDALEVEIQSENPSKGKVKAFLSSVKDFAIKTGADVTSKIVVELIKGQLGI